MAALVANPVQAQSLDRVFDSSMAPYEPAAYSSLPSLRQAAEKCQETNSVAHITGPIRDLFLRHRLQNDLGIALLHKHFDIKSTERLVDYRSISAPWGIGEDKDAVVSKYESFVVPRSFRLIDNKFVPYEFDFSETDKPFTANTKFLSELSTLFYEHGLENILGIRVLDKHDSELTVEVTEGNMNIMIGRGIVPDNQLIEALWVFNEEEDDACHCREFCRSDSSGHFESNHACG